MKQVRGTWPTWPPPAEVNVDAVTDTALTILARGCNLNERQVKLLQCSVFSSVKVGFKHWETFASLVKSAPSDSDQPIRDSDKPGAPFTLRALEKRGMAQPGRKNNR